MRTSKSARYANTLAWALPFLFTLAAWYWAAVLNPLPFWQIESDYSWLSLSHAYTVESKISGFPAINDGYTVHPGIPFGIASWIALRLSSLSVYGANERIAYGLIHADRYWAFAKAISLLLNLGGLWVMRYFFEDKLKFFLMAAAAYLATLPAVYNSALFQLSNESFALLYSIGFYALAYILLSPATPPAGSVGNTGATFAGPRRITCFFIGVMTAVGWSIKIYYLAPSIGLLIGMIVAASLKVFSWNYIRTAAVFYLAGFLTAMLVIVFGFLGWHGFKEWCYWNWKMLFHAGYYGTEDEGFLSWRMVLMALTKLVTSTRGAFPAMVGVVLALACGTIISNRKDQNWIRTYLPFSVMAVFGLSMNLMAVLKHYAPHYAISVVANLGCLIFIVSTDRTRSNAFRALYILIPVCLALTLSVAKSDHIRQLQKAAAVSRDLSVISKLPMEPGKRRIWAYFSPTREGIASMVSFYAGSPFVDGIIKKTLGVIDSSPTFDPESKDWQYVIFPKVNYPTSASLASNYKNMFDFRSSNFQMTGDEKVTELETFLVVELQPR